MLIRSHSKRIHPKWKFLLAGAVFILIVAYGFNASTPGRTVEGCLQGCSTTDDRKAGPLRVLSLNMLHGFPKFKDLQLRSSLIAEEIRRLDADVVLLQEVPWTITTGNVANAIANQLGYNHTYYRANGNKNLIFFEEGEAILSRYPLSQVVFTELQPRMGFFESRVTLGAMVTTPQGEVRLFVAHLTDKDPKINEGQAQSLRSFVETHSSSTTVVAGDFNAQEDSPQIKQLATVWIDTYRAMHPNDEGLTCCIDDLNAGPVEPLEERIDYIFLIPKAGKIISAEHVFNHPFQIGGGWQWASDHTGLMVTIEP